MEPIIFDSSELHDAERKKRDNILSSGGDPDFINAIASKKPFPMLNKDIIIAMSKRNPPLYTNINDSTIKWCRNSAIAMLGDEKNNDIIENLSMTLLAYLSIAKEK